MDKRKGVINIVASLFFKFLMLAESLLLRRFFIQYLGNEFNGLSSLYANIIGVLSITDLGIAGAIVFSMYKPIVAHDTEKVAALYNLYKRLYLIIGAIVFIAGVALMPLLPFIANGYSEINVNLYLTFGLSLLGTVISYLNGANTSLVCAHKFNYIATAIASIGKIVLELTQIFVVIFTGSFVLYQICGLVAGALEWGVTVFIVKKKFPDILSFKKVKLDAETKKEVFRNTRAQFMHKIGDILVSGIDSLVISAFINITVLGKFNNYNMIINYVGAVISMFLSSLSSVIGIACAENTKEQNYRYLKFFHTFNFFIVTVAYLGYYGIADDLLSILLGENLELVWEVPFIISLNAFIGFMRNAVLSFRDATGCFYYDRWKPLAEGVINLGLSILLVKVLPDEFRVAGVIVATIITTLLISHIVEPYVLFKHGLQMKAKPYYLKNYFFILLFTVALTLLHILKVPIANPWLSLLVNGFISVGISFPICLIIYLIDKEFRTEANHLIVMGWDHLKKAFKKFKRNKTNDVQP